MWDILLQNLPTVLLVIAAAVICGAELIKAFRVWKEEHQNKINQGVAKKQQECNLNEEFNKLHGRFDLIEKRLDDLELRMAASEGKLQDLTDSDMHDIKAWIVGQYQHFYVRQGWIDAYSADTIEKRYEDYKKEGGNSYIATLMEHMRTLPMDPSQSIRRHPNSNTDTKA